MHQDTSMETTTVTYRVSKRLHEELRRAARRRGVSQNAFVRESLENAVLGSLASPADKASLTAVLWISDYLRVASKRDKDELARMWQTAEIKAEELLA